MTVTIPGTHEDLLVEPVYAVLTTMMPDSTPQTSIVWADYDGEFVLVNTTLERQKGKNMLRYPRVSMLIIDPKNTSRWIEIRGTVVEMVADDAETHADKLTQLYTGKQRFYGDIYPVDQKQKETRVIVKIEPNKVSVDAIFR
jgi:PPOX class probable F420-dependent enzyme